MGNRGPDNTNFDHLVQSHPCLDRKAHGKSGRMHLPVSPVCNIQCGFCRRAFNKVEVRPGVAAGILTPEEAVEAVGKGLELCPEITVIGIAGPGDTLATPHAVRTFELVHAAYPKLIKCLSTNGLLLKDKVEDLVRGGVSTLTVTVNGLSPQVVAQVVPQVLYQGRALTGEEGAALLTWRQLEGIRRAVEAGLYVKINMVLVPGVNDHEVGATAQAVKDAGARIFNLIPLIPQGDFADLPPPDCKVLTRSRLAAEAVLPVFRHCSHCRADACGIPGVKDFSTELYGRELAAQTFSHG